MIGFASVLIGGVSASPGCSPFIFVSCLLFVPRQILCDSKELANADEKGEWSMVTVLQLSDDKSERDTKVAATKLLCRRCRK